MPPFSILWGDLSRLSSEFAIGSTEDYARIQRSSPGLREPGFEPTCSWMRAKMPGLKRPSRGRYCAWIARNPSRLTRDGLSYALKPLMILRRSCAVLRRVPYRAVPLRRSPPGGLLLGHRDWPSATRRQSRPQSVVTSWRCEARYPDSPEYQAVGRARQRR